MLDPDGWIEVCQVPQDQSTSRWDIELRSSGGEGHG